MQRIAPCLLAVLMTCAFAVAQQASDLHAAPPAKAVTISGTLSSDGKTLVSDQDDVWTVSNAEALKGHEGRQVVVKCRPDSKAHSIHVYFLVRRDEPRYAADRGDSAFRR